jgi:hypothetical protein
MNAETTKRSSCASIARNQKVEPSLSGLVALGACLAGSPPGEAERLAGTMLASEGGHWLSSLNNDGSPLQVSLSLPGCGARRAVRLIADPAAELADGGQRWRRAGRILSTVLASHAPDLKRLCNSVIEGVLPVEPAARAELPGGAVWLSADLSGHGMALYATAKWGDGRQRWMRTRRWLDGVLPTSSAAHEILDRLASRSVLVSVGVEGTTPSNARVKLYWRLTETAGLRDLGLPMFDSEAISEFLFEVIGDRRILRTGIVGSIGFRVASGSFSDVKLDVCGHCVRRTPMDWMRVIERSIARHELARLPVECPTPLEAAELAFIGFGLDSERTPRLNIYLKRSTYERKDCQRDSGRLAIPADQGNFKRIGASLRGRVL